MTDPSGNAASGSRLVNVDDTLPPVLQLTPGPSILECGSGSYVEPGATATDACMGDVTGRITRAGTINLGQVGRYSLTYAVMDAAGNSTSASRQVAVQDTQAPMLSLIGPAASTHECGSFFVDPGATASDICAGDLTGSIAASGAVNAGAVGSYTLSYFVTDPSGNAASSISRAVTVSDTLPPILSLTGPAADAHECGAGPYLDPGAAATDQCAGNLTAAIVTHGSVNAGAVGGYTLSYGVADPSGNTTGASRAVTVQDTTPPVLRVVGPAAQHECGSGPYVDLGATATDQCVGDLTAAIVTRKNVDVANVGSYLVSYGVTDPSGNAASASRAVTVQDTIPPVLSVVGPAAQHECGSGPYVDLGATATDQCVGDLTAAIVTRENVDEANVGSYSVSYVVMDPSGNAASASRAVSVRDTIPPVLSLVGDSSVTHECGTHYTDPGATASDLCSGSCTAAIVADNQVDTSATGTYSVHYHVTDGAGLQSSGVRSVSVQDTLAPVISLNPGPTVLECAGAPYVDAGATAMDLCGGDLSDNLVASSTLNQSRPGQYTITYQVADAAGNSSTAVRPLQVVDTQPPVLHTSQIEMWPPNHKMRAFTLADCVSVTEACDTTLNVNAAGSISSIFSDEPEDMNGTGDGQTMDDIVITGPSSFELRSERDGTGNGRVYGVNFKVTDASGNQTSGTCYFTVPHDQSGVAAVNDGPESGYAVPRSYAAAP